MGFAFKKPETAAGATWPAIAIGELVVEVIAALTNLTIT